jgi:hypothetical protein
VDIFGFTSWCLVLVTAVSLLWPLNALFLALAYRVRQGTTPVGMETYEFWWRCIVAALGLGVLALCLLGLDYMLVHTRELPQGPVQVILVLLYLPASIGFLFWILALEDMLQATSVFFLYILLPGLPLLLIGRLAGVWESVKHSAPWLLHTI